jgi:FkbM family methyltransferase
MAIDAPDDEAGPPSGKTVGFDSFNVVVNHNEAREYIELLVGVPLTDGERAKVKVILLAPEKLLRSDGRAEYSMKFDTSISVVHVEKDSKGNEVAAIDGLSWEIPADYPGARTVLLENEPMVKGFLTERFWPGDAFVDAGANVGSYSVRAAASGMKVYSFEPNPENVKVLRRNAEINHVSIDLFECALGSAEGEVRLSPNGALSRVSADGAVHVPVHTLDSFDLPRVDLLKVDVEGHELEVLKGAGRTIERFHPDIIIEMHDWLDAEGQASLLDMLLKNGYRIKYVDKQAYGRHLTATAR